MINQIQAQKIFFFACKQLKRCFFIVIVPAGQLFTEPLQTAVVVADKHDRRTLIKVHVIIFELADVSFLIVHIELVHGVEQCGTCLFEREIQFQRVDLSFVSGIKSQFHPGKTVKLCGDISGDIETALFCFCGKSIFFCGKTAVFNGVEVDFSAI